MGGARAEGPLLLSPLSLGSRSTFHVIETSNSHTPVPCRMEASRAFARGTISGFDALFGGLNVVYDDGNKESGVIFEKYEIVGSGLRVVESTLMTTENNASAVPNAAGCGLS